MPIDDHGVWRRNVNWFRNGIGRTDIQQNILNSPEFKIAEYLLGNLVVSVSARELRRALVNAPKRPNRSVVGPYNIDINHRTIHGVQVELKVDSRRLDEIVSALFETSDDHFAENEVFDNEYFRNLEDDLQGDGVFSPFSVQDAKDTVFRAVVQRRGQRDFRAKLMDAYQSKCAVTKNNCSEVLEAAHIISYSGESTNHVQNGILLRADIHTLFDLGLLKIDGNYIVRVSERLTHTDYWQLDGSKLALPALEIHWPNAQALEMRTTPV